jgi:integrase
MSKPIRLPSGQWRIRWINETGGRQSAVYPTAKEAAFQLARRNTEVAEVVRGYRAPTPAPRLFSELCDKYLANRSGLKRRPRYDGGIIDKHLRPHFGAFPLTALGVEQIDSYKHAKTHLAPKTLHTQLTLLRTMMGYALELGWITKVPKVKKPRIRLLDKDFRYLRTKGEVDRFLLAARVEGDLVFALYAAATFTGMREGELAGLRWDDADFDRRLITVQRSYDGPTKSGDLRHVPILDPLLPTLRKWRLKNPSPWVFPNQAGGMQGECARVFQEVFHRVVDRAGFPRAERNGKQRRYITFHDLRHTFASHWVMNGGSGYKLRGILGHKSEQMVARYAHLAPHAYEAEHGLFGEYTSTVESVVIPLPLVAAASTAQE